MSCPTCQIITCTNPSDFQLYNLNDGTIFTNPRFSFVMDCPPGYSCHGPYPITITIPPGTIVLPVPPNPTVIRLQCCESEISRNVPPGATAAQIAAISAEVIAICAAQQAQCDVKTQPPGPGIPPPTKITPPGDPPATRTDIWNTSQTAQAYCGNGNDGIISKTIAAHMYGTTLFNATPQQIANSQNALNLIALQQVTMELIGAAPIITTAVCPTATPSTPYSFEIPVTGGTEPYTFGITSGSLPTGLSMDSDGLITGTATIEGTSTFTVAILDAIGNQCSRELSLQVAASTTWCDPSTTKRLRIQGYAPSMFTSCPVCFFDPSVTQMWDGTFPDQHLLGFECAYSHPAGFGASGGETQFGDNGMTGILQVVKTDIALPPFDVGFWYVYIVCYNAGSPDDNAKVLWLGSKPIVPGDEGPTGAYTYVSGCNSGISTVVIESYDP